MKLSQLTGREVNQAATAVKRAVSEARDAAISGDRGKAYAAAERAEHAAHELKQLFALTPDELLAALGKE